MWTTENRPRYDRDKLRYPSDLTDAEWGAAPVTQPVSRLMRRPYGQWMCRAADRRA